MISVNDVLTVISVISTLCAIVFGYVAFSRTRRMDSKQEGEKNAAVLTEMSYIKGGMDEMKRKMETQEKRHLECTVHLAKVEATANKAHERIDEITGGISPLLKKEG